MKFWPFKRDAADGRIALGNFNLTAQLPNQRTIQVAGYMYSDDDKDTLNERLDLYQEVIERQRLRCEIPELEAKREAMLNGMRQAREVLTELETRMKNGDRLNSQELLTVNNMRTNLKKANEEIEKGSAAIAEAKKKANVG